MAVLSVPSNTPTLDGAVIGCTTDDTSGIAYAMARTDRQWYSVANGDSQALADADKATIIAQDITAPELVWAGTDEDLATIQLTIDGLPARLDPANPYYVGWVQEPEEGAIYGDDFVMEFNIAANGETLVFPVGTAGTNTGEIDWGDGNTTTLSGGGNYSNVYAESGLKVVRISGPFAWPFFNNTGDCLKARRILNWGNTGIDNLNKSFHGCSGITAITSESGSLPLADNMLSAFRDLTGLTDPSGMSALTTVTESLSYGFYSLSSLVTGPDLRNLDTSAVETMYYCFRECSSLTSPPRVDNWSLPLCTNYHSALRGWTGTLASGVDIAIDTWDVSAGITFTSFLNGSRLTTSCYDRVLAAWSQLDMTGVEGDIHFGESTYTNSEPTLTHRSTLEGMISGEITDGGPAA